MKSYVVCSLVLFQIVSIYGASERALGFEIKQNGYVEYQSERSKDRNDSFVIDQSFEPSGIILDWFDLTEGKEESVRVIALVKMNAAGENRHEQAFAQLKPLFDNAAGCLLPMLKRELREHGCSLCCGVEYSVDEEKHTESVKNIALLAFCLQTKELDGQAEVTYNPAAVQSKRWQASLVERKWYSSLHVTHAEARTMGCLNFQAAERSVHCLKEIEEDLHMLIFHRKPALVTESK